MPDALVLSSTSLVKRLGSLVRVGVEVRTVTVGRVGARDPNRCVVVVLDTRTEDVDEIKRIIEEGWAIVLVTPSESELWWGVVASGQGELLRSSGSDRELEARVLGMLEREARRVFGPREMRLFAHDLSNPLTAIRMHADLLAMDASTFGAETGAILEEISEVVDTMSVMIGGLRQLAKLDLSGCTPGQRFPVDLASLMASSSNRPALKRVVVNRVPVGLLVDGDPVLLQVAFTHLLFNAVRLCESQSSVDVTGSRGAGGYVVRIRHAARDIEVALQSRFGHRFGAVDLHSAKVRVGPMGWVFAAQVFEAHGGSLSFAVANGTAVIEAHLPSDEADDDSTATLG